MPDRKYQSPDVAVVYIAWGQVEKYPVPYHRFLESYGTYLAGINHRLYIIFKGFDSAVARSTARNIFAGAEHTPIFTSDEELDIGAYFEAAAQIPQEYVCFLNTNSRINGHNWLKKLYVNLTLPGVGLVGATGSFGRTALPGLKDDSRPNVHIRSNGFMMRRRDFLSMRPERPVVTKEDAYQLEHGLSSFTAVVRQSGQDVLVVGKNGRGYSPPFWPVSDTYSQGDQGNLLILDNRTDQFAMAGVVTKQFIFSMAWLDGEVRPELANQRNLPSNRDISQ